MTGSQNFSIPIALLLGVRQNLGRVFSNTKEKDGKAITPFVLSEFSKN